MSVKQRILSALAANAFGQGVTIATQILLTPLFFKSWGALQYGEWLILSSVPAYLTMADMGLGTAAANEMTMRAGARDHEGAQRTYRGALWVASGAAMLALLVGALAAACVIFLGVPHTTTIEATQSSAILMMLSVSVALGFYHGVVFAGFRCAGLNATGTMLANTARLLEAITMGALLIMGQSPLWLCTGAVMVKAVLLLAQWMALRQSCPWLFTPRVSADRQLVRRLIVPSLGFLAFPLGNALALQGPILLIGAFMGGQAVAIFSAMRTLARLPIQITNVLNNSVAPEISRAFGDGNQSLIRQIHRHAWGITLALSVLSAAAIALLGPWLSKLWLGAGKYNALVLNALILTSVLSALWNISSVALTAVNAHGRLSVIYVLVNSLSLAISAVLGQHLGMPGILCGLILADALLLWWMLPNVLKQTGDQMGAFFKGFWPSPQGQAPRNT